jgi:hypothetical protein
LEEEAKKEERKKEINNGFYFFLLILIRERKKESQSQGFMYHKEKDKRLPEYSPQSELIILWFAKIAYEKE